MANPHPSNSIKPGETRNPNGRPPSGYSFTEAARKVISANPDRKRKLFEKLFEKAEQGDLKAIEMLWGYLDGRPVQTSNVLLSEEPEEKVKRTLALLKNNVLPSGSSDILQDKGGQPVPSDEGSE